MEPKADTIRILTLNIFCRPCPICSYALGDRKTERIKMFVKYLSRHFFDIVCLQEMFSSLSNGRINFFLKETRKLGFLYHLKSEKQSFFKFDSGLLIISRFPIIDFDFSPFLSFSGYESFVEKGVLYARILHENNHVLHVFTTHFQSKNNPQVKRKQIKQLGNFILKNVKEGSNIIVTGDFNIEAVTEKEDYEDLMESIGLGKYKVDDVVFSVNKKHENTTLGHGQIFPNNKSFGIVKKRLDYIFCVEMDKRIKINDSGILKLSDENNDQLVISDHHGVFAEIELY